MQQNLVVPVIHLETALVVDGNGLNQVSILDEYILFFHLVVVLVCDNVSINLEARLNPTGILATYFHS